MTSKKRKYGDLSARPLPTEDPTLIDDVFAAFTGTRPTSVPAAESPALADMAAAESPTPAQRATPARFTAPAQRASAAQKGSEPLHNLPPSPVTHASRTTCSTVSCRRSTHTIKPCSCASSGSRAALTLTPAG